MKMENTYEKKDVYVLLSKLYDKNGFLMRIEEDQADCSLEEATDNPYASSYICRRKSRRKIHPRNRFVRASTACSMLEAGLDNGILESYENKNKYYLLKLNLLMKKTDREKAAPLLDQPFLASKQSNTLERFYRHWAVSQVAAINRKTRLPEKKMFQWKPADLKDMKCRLSVPKLPEMSH